jgi:hypothetical protein
MLLDLTLRSLWRERLTTPRGVVSRGGCRGDDRDPWARLPSGITRPSLAPSGPSAAGWPLCDSRIWCGLVMSLAGSGDAPRADRPFAVTRIAGPDGS